MSDRLDCLLSDESQKKLELPIENENEEVRSEALVGMKQIAAVLLQCTSQQRAFISVRHEWLVECIGRELEKFYDNFIARICRDYSKTTKLECEVDYNIDHHEEM